MSVELYDEEILKIERVLQSLKSVSGLPRNIDDFDKRIVEEFERIGFRVDVKWYYTNVDGVYQPEIDIIGKTHTEEFDHDKHVHEVVNNILNLPDQKEGFIPVGKREIEMLESGTTKNKGKHGDC